MAEDTGEQISIHDRQQLWSEKNQKSKKIIEIKSAIKELVEVMPDRVVIPEEDGTFFVISKSNDRFRLAKTKDSEIRMGGYEPDFQKMTAFEAVMFGSAIGGNDKGLGKVYSFDIDKLKARDTDPYWGGAKKVILHDEGRNYDVTDDERKLLETAPLTSALPKVVEFAKQSQPQA